MKPAHHLPHGRRAAALLAAPGAAFAADVIQGGEKQATNWTAIAMFAVFVAFTLFITKWAASKTKSASDFYTAGGGITGFQNGLAIAGDYMSAASFLGISAAVMISRLRRAHLLDRLPRRLADPDLPDGRAAAQPRQVHLRRRRRLPLRPDPGAHLRGLGHARRRRLLPDRADGRRRLADRAALRPRLLDRRRHRRRR